MFACNAIFGWFTKKTVQTGWSAGAYLVGDRVVIHSMSRTHNGIGWYNQPVYGIAADALPAMVGGILREALNASTWESSEDDSCREPHPVVLEAGARNWRDLEATSKFASIDTDKQTVTILPSRPTPKSEGGKGFTPDPERQIQLDWSGDDANLGQALLEAFSRSEARMGQ